MSDVVISLHEPHVLGAPPGRDGEEVSLQKTTTHIQWRLGQAAWTDLVPLSEIVGPQGNKGDKGDKGDDGLEVEIGVSETHIQWRYIGGDDWMDLVPLATLVGEQGEPGAPGNDGAPGADGADGLTPVFSIGSVDTLPPGSPAEVEVEGDAPNFVLNFALPEGRQGLSGEGGSLERIAITGATTVNSDHRNRLLDMTGTFTLSFDAVTALGNGFVFYARNAGTGNITLDPNSTETIDGLASYIMYPGEVRLIQCDGTALRSIVLHPFNKTFTASATFVKPSGYAYFEGILWAGGGSGAKSSATNYASGGGGGAGIPFKKRAEDLSASTAFTIGAGATGPSAANTDGASGGNSTFDDVTAYGGGPGSQGSTAGRPGGGGGGVYSAGGVGDGGQPSANISGSYLVVSFGGGWGFGVSADAIHGGGAGGRPVEFAIVPGGKSFTGGGGGGGVNPSGTANSAGTSVLGGDGGVGNLTTSGADGQAPGGGGGATRTGPKAGNGARGELRVWGLV